MEHLIAIGLGAALGVLVVRAEVGWLPTLAVLAVLGWCIVSVMQTYPPPVAMVFGFATVASGVALRMVDRHRLRRQILAVERDRAAD